MLELEILRFLELGRTPVFNFLLKNLTIFGESTVLFVLITLFYFVINKEFGRKLTYIAAFSNVINGVVKNFVQRPRPFNEEAWGDKAVSCVYPDTATGYSFPSGHTQACSNYSVAIAHNYKKKWMIIVAPILIVIVAFSRLYLGAHYPTDVLVGAILGIGCAYLGGFFINNFGYKKTFLVTIIALFPFVVYFCFDGLLIQKDMYSGYGMLVGAFFGFLFEEKFVNFKLNDKIWKRFLEMALALAIAVGLKGLLKLPYEHANIPDFLYNLLDCVRYTIVCFVTIGVCPWLFKKIKI